MTKADNEVMLPCPFCGSENTDESMSLGYKVGDQSQPVIAAGCYDCGALGPEVLVPDHSNGYGQSISRWNTRLAAKQDAGQHKQGAEEHY